MKLKNLRKDFDELRHKFDKEEIDRYREYFYVAKTKKYLFESEMNKKNKNLNELEKSLILEKFQGNDMLLVFIMKILITIIIIIIIIMLIMILINTKQLEPLKD